MAYFFMIPALIPVLILLLPVRAEAHFRIRSTGICSRIKMKILLGLIPIRIRISVEYRYPHGLILFINNKEYSVLGNKKPRFGLELFKTVRVLGINADGIVGINDSPAASAFVCGAANVLATDLLLAIFKIKPNIMIQASFSKDVFAVNADCIASFIPGRLLIEGIKPERRIINESSDRKHNAFVNGAR